MKKFGIIGAAGYIAPRHMKAIKDTGNQLSLAFDVNDSVGIIDSFGHDTEFYTDFERFYNRLLEMQEVEDTKVDFLVICSPNYLHFTHIALGLRAGCDIICEKPLVANVSSIERLSYLEKITGKKVYTILQLRHHASIIELHKQYQSHDNSVIHKVNLTYITSRGKWYMESWKGDVNKSFGVLANIGIHFFDMLTYIFGEVVHVDISNQSPNKASGELKLTNATVNWFLSVDPNDLPSEIKEHQTTFRNIVINGKELEFSNGFTELHTRSYKEILKGNGFGLDEARPSIELLNTIENKSNSQKKAV